MAKHCKDCLHWGADSFMLPSLHGDCLVTNSEDGQPVTEGTLAYALDGEDERAVLITHAEFGCVQWAKK